MCAEVVHGVARTLWLTPRVGDLRSRQLGVLSGSILVLAIGTLASRWLHARTDGQRLAVGGLWVALTVVFEVVLGRFGLGYAWDRVLADFNVFAGGLLPFGLAVMALTPVVAGRVVRPHHAAAAHRAPPG
jgi:hypothetical protein